MRAFVLVYNKSEKHFYVRIENSNALVYTPIDNENKSFNSDTCNSNASLNPKNYFTSKPS